MRPLLIVLVIILIDQIGFSQSNRVTYFDEPYLEYTLTVHNPNISKTKHIINVGVESQLIYGNFECLSGAHQFPTDADFEVEFHVTKENTEIDANPIFALKPQETYNIRISLIPNTIGSSLSACAKALL